MTSSTEAFIQELPYEERTQDLGSLKVGETSEKT